MTEHVIHNKDDTAAFFIKVFNGLYHITKHSNGISFGIAMDEQSLFEMLDELFVKYIAESKEVAQ